MPKRSYSDEVAYCRHVAADLMGSERPLMLRIADAFRDLAAPDLQRAEEKIGRASDQRTL